MKININMAACCFATFYCFYFFTKTSKRIFTLGMIFYTRNCRKVRSATQAIFENIDFRKITFEDFEGTERFIWTLVVSESCK